MLSCHTSNVHKYYCPSPIVRKQLTLSQLRHLLTVRSWFRWTAEEDSWWTLLVTRFYYMKHFPFWKTFLRRSLKTDPSLSSYWSKLLLTSPASRKNFSAIEIGLSLSFKLLERISYLAMKASNCTITVRYFPAPKVPSTWALVICSCNTHIHKIFNLRDITVVSDWENVSRALSSITKKKLGYSLVTYTSYHSVFKLSFFYFNSNKSLICSGYLLVHIIECRSSRLSCR